MAGKLRRYHGVPLWKQLLDLPTVFKNLRDIVFIGGGFVQSIIMLQRFRPDVVFAKGGYVCLPLGYAAKVLNIPLVIHDSDARPGLTNRLLSRFATAIATGSPLENYTYPADKSTYTGVPIDDTFHPFSKEEQQRAKQAIGVVDLDKPLVVVTGGGLGAESINTAISTIAEALIADGFALYHVTGKKHFKTVKASAYEHPDYHVTAFVYKDMATVLGAADIVVSRGSATFLQELAALAKPTIIVPAAHLGDQMRNAETYKAARAAIIVDDRNVRDGETLYQVIVKLHDDPAGAKAMASRFFAFARSNAALDVAQLIVRANKDTQQVS